jgi:hypothetical protein
MIRSIDIHTGHTPFDTYVTVIDGAESSCAVLRIHVGGATVNIFGDLNRQAEIRRAAAALNTAFGENELGAIREAAE